MRPVFIGLFAERKAIDRKVARRGAIDPLKPKPQEVGPSGFR